MHERSHSKFPRPVPADEVAHILIVDDDPTQLRFAALALRYCEVSSSLHIARSPAEAARRVCAGDKPPIKPHLVLLTVRCNSAEHVTLLDELKHNDATKGLPVVTLLEGDTDESTRNSLSELANCAVPRPTDPDGWTALMRALETLWLQSPSHAQRPKAPLQPHH